MTKPEPSQQELVERVARALCENDQLGMDDPVALEDAHVNYQRRIRQAARAVLASLPTAQAANQWEGIATDDQIAELVNLITDLADADALDRAFPEVRAWLAALPPPPAGEE